MKMVPLETILNHPFCCGKYDHENGNLDFICGCETIAEFAEAVAIEVPVGPVKMGEEE